jgi:hypothetical protein
VSHATPSDTRRGLGLVFVAEVTIILLALLLAIGAGGPLTVLVTAAAGALSMLAFYFLWIGRHEYTERRRPIQWAFGLFLLSAVAAVAMWLSVTSTVTETNRIDDLRAAVFIVPFLLVSEAVALTLLAWPLAGRREKVLLGVFVAAAVIATPVIVVQGLDYVDDLVLRFGEQVSDESTAADEAVLLFAAFIKTALAAYILISRAAAGYVLWRLLGRLADEEASRSTPGSGPSTTS